MRVALVLSAAASSLAPSAPILLSAARGAHAGRTRGGRGERVRRTLGAARRTTPLHACAHGGAAGCGRGAAARTAEVQRGKSLVLLERGGQLFGPLVADLILCGMRVARAVWAQRTRAAYARGRRNATPPACVGARGRSAVPWGVGGAPLHALPRFSVVRFLFSLSAAASSLAPSSPIELPAARGSNAP